MHADGYDFGGNTLDNLGNAVSSSSAVTKGQMDTAIAAAVSGLDFKGSVRAASTADVNIASAPSTLDGVTLANGNRVLLKDQTDPEDNGVYVFTAAASALTRATDFDSNAEVTAGAWVSVSEGTTNADTWWWLTTNDPIVVGTTALTFEEFLPGGGGGGGSSFAATGPSSGATTWTVTHNLGTRDVIVQVYEIATNTEVDVEVERNTVNAVIIKTTPTMGANEYRAVVKS